MLIDTHAHLDFPDFASDLPEVLSRASAAGVTRMLTISTSVDGGTRAIALAQTHSNVFATVGVHPSNAGEVPENFISKLRDLAVARRVAAIGECGLDYHRLPSRRMHESAVATSALGNETPVDVDAAIQDGAVKAQQAAVFEQQLELALELDLPVIIHERDAWDDALALIEPYTGKLRAVFHCFGKSLEHARQVLAWGHLVSFTGIVTFKNARELQETARQLPAGTFMVETDCPFLAPTPFRGQRSEPAHTREVAQFIAQLRGTSLEQVAAATTATAERFFKFAR